ncbi:hypothetical protein [Planobispora longispora]|uniref:Uncharacterized protein n=1 Tax=Planobispora longispora TaxID=28887 RepID=A0A8J3RS86_9ACTN|nr:hypothetical protein [Planobispora longispora]GIH80857.1 hypothetical protein Plo01_72860 [Planobispora longispora]
MTRRIGDLIEDILDRASDVEHDLRRAARTAVEERDRDDDRGDDADCAEDLRDLEEILDDLEDVYRRLRRCDGLQGRDGSRRRPRERGADRSRFDIDDLAGHVARLSRRVDGLSQQVRASRPDNDAG